MRFRLLAVAVLSLLAAAQACPVKAGRFLNGAAAIPAGYQPLCDRKFLATINRRNQQGGNPFAYAETYRVPGRNTAPAVDAVLKLGYQPTALKNTGKGSVSWHFRHKRTGQMFLMTGGPTRDHGWILLLGPLKFKPKTPAR